MTAGCTLPLRGNQANGCTRVVPGLAGPPHSPRRERLLARLRMKSDRKAAETRGVVRLTTAGLEKQQTEGRRRSATWILKAAILSECCSAHLSCCRSQLDFGLQS